MISDLENTQKTSLQYTHLLMMKNQEFICGKIVKVKTFILKITKVTLQQQHHFILSRSVSKDSNDSIICAKHNLHNSNKNSNLHATILNIC